MLLQGAFWGWHGLGHLGEHQWHLGPCRRGEAGLDISLSVGGRALASMRIGGWYGLVLIRFGAVGAGILL